jgi:hypothetical protein
LILKYTKLQIKKEILNACSMMFAGKQFGLAALEINRKILPQENLLLSK